jgi:hypothetical protein
MRVKCTEDPILKSWLLPTCPAEIIASLDAAKLAAMDYSSKAALLVNDDLSLGEVGKLLLKLLHIPASRVSWYLLALKPEKVGEDPFPDALLQRPLSAKFKDLRAGRVCLNSFA